MIPSTNSAVLPRLRRYIRRPWPEKIRAAGLYARYAIPSLPVPVRLPFGAWVLAWNDDLGNHILARDFEQPEYAFVGRFLKPGMTVLDIGANQGLYTLLASSRVGPKGLVISFEPSPRERRRLHLDVWMNFCSNVRVQPVALGATAGLMELFVVHGGETGCNSLRPPAVKGRTSRVSVKVETLDGFIFCHELDRVDFIKMDVEGAEWSVLQGAQRLFATPPRPVLLIEVYDIRTLPWGYAAREIVKHLNALGFRIFRPTENGGLEAEDVCKESFDANVVAVPEERMTEVADFLAQQGAHA